MFHKLIDYGTCNLHIVPGSFKTGAEKSNWGLHKVLRGVYQILRDSPATPCSFVQLGGWRIRPLLIIFLSFGLILGNFLLYRSVNITKIKKYGKEALNDPLTEAKLYIYFYVLYV